jgi:type II secretory pathway pseudopilin PulG
MIHANVIAARKPILYMRRQVGFSLVEIAFVLVIAGLALGAGLSVLGSRLAQGRIDTTRDRSEAIRQALVAFVAQNARLPCPAAPGIVEGVAGYNVERVAGVAGAQTCTAGAGLTNTIAGAAPLGVSRGTVPCTTLGLTNEACLDAWGSRFTYFVQNAAVRLTPNTVSGMRGSMTVHTVVAPGAAVTNAGLAPTGNQINACSAIAGDNACNLAAVAMVISHGANRGGGFVPTSAVVMPAVGGVSAYETENSDNNIQFMQNAYIEDGANSFDDIVVALVPRDIVSTLSQLNVMRLPNVAMAERFAQIRVALLSEMLNPVRPFPAQPLPVQTGGGAGDRGLSLAVGTPAAPLTPLQPQVFPAAAQTANCPAAALLNNTLLLPTVANVPALSVASGLRNDIWGNPIRYKLFATNGVSNAGACAVGTPTAHTCAPVPNDTIRSGQCQTPFVLVSYGPNGVANTGIAATDDDLFLVVTNQEVTTFVLGSGGW